MKKRIISVAIIAVIGAVITPIAFNSIRYRMNPVAAALIPLMDGTEWSPNYSYATFRKIEVGMTTNDVMGIMGECLGITHYKDQTQWHYTRGLDGGIMSCSKYSTHYRIITFGPDGLVSGKTYTFYFDSSNESEFVALIADEFRTCIALLYTVKVTSGWWQVAKKNNVFGIILSHCLFFVLIC